MDPKKDKIKIIEAAERFISSGKLQEAIVEYEKLLGGEEPDIHISMIVGDLYSKLGKDDKAFDLFHSIATHCEKKGLLTQARAAYKKMINLDPKDIQSGIKLADLLRIDGFLTEAKVEYLKIAGRLSEAKRTKELISVYEKIVKLDKKDNESRVVLAGLYTEEGLVDQAVGELNDVAESLLEKNELKEAEKVLNQAKKINESYDRTVSNLIKLYRKENKIREALGLVEDKLRENKDSIEFLNLMGDLCMEDRNFKRAEEIFSKISAADPLNVDVRIKLGRIRILHNDLNKAYELYEPLVNNLLKKNNPEKAIGLLGLILTSEKIHLPTLEKLASIYKSRNERKNLEVVDRVIFEECRERNLKEKMLAVLQELLELCPRDEEFNYEYRALTGKEKIRLPLEKHKIVEKIPPPEVKIPEKKKEEKFPPPPPPPPLERKVVKKIEFEKFPPVPPPSEERKIVEKVEVERFPSPPMEAKIPEKKEEKVPPPPPPPRVEQKVIEKKEVEKFPLPPPEIKIPEKKREEKFPPPPPPPPLERKIAEKIEFEKFPPKPPERKMEERKHLSLDEAKVLERQKEGAYPSLSDKDLQIIKMSFSKAELYLEQGLIRNARRILENLRMRYADEPLIEEKIAYIDKIQSQVSDEEIPFLVQKVTAKEAEIEGETRRRTDHVKSSMYLRDELDEEDRVTAAELFEDTDIVPTPTREFGEKIFYDLREKIDEELAMIQATLYQQLAGKTTIMEKDLADIVAEFKRGMEEKVDKKDYESHYNLGIAFFEQGLIDEAIEEFKVASKDKRQTVDCYSIISYCYRQKRDFHEAVRWVEKGIEFSKANSSQQFALKYELASIYEELKEMEKALALYSQIKEWNPEYKDVSERVHTLEKIVAEKSF